MCSSQFGGKEQLLESVWQEGRCVLVSAARRKSYSNRFGRKEGLFWSVSWEGTVVGVQSRRKEDLFWSVRREGTVVGVKVEGRNSCWHRCNRKQDCWDQCDRKEHVSQPMRQEGCHLVASRTSLFFSPVRLFSMVNETCQFMILSFISSPSFAHVTMSSRTAHLLQKGSFTIHPHSSTSCSHSLLKFCFSLTLFVLRSSCALSYVRAF